MYKCVAPNGVAFRRTPRLSDKVLDRPGPYHGEFVVVARTQQQQQHQRQSSSSSSSSSPVAVWLLAANGLWLPLAIADDVKFEFVKLFL